MNLYIINESNRAASYGIGTYIKELTAELKESEINICLVHLLYNENNAEIDEMKEICKTYKISHLYIPSPFKWCTTLEQNKQFELYYKNVVYLLRIQIKKKRKLIFHLNYNHNGKLAEELKNAFKCRIVVTTHYLDWSFIIFDNLQRLRSILNKAHLDNFCENITNMIEKEKKLYSTVDHVICLSKYLKKVLCQYYELDASKIIVIPNGLTDMVTTKFYVKFLKTKWNIHFQEKIILYVGRMEEVKGLNYLIKAFRNVLLVFPQSRLILAGNGDFRKYTKESQDICTKVTYTGFLDKSQLSEWYSLADVGVIPSLFEPFGYVALEMMMHELPIVATSTSGLNEVVDEKSGMKVPLIEYPDRVEVDTQLLAEKILYLLQNPIEAKIIGQNGRKRYLKEYTSEVFRKNMLNFYQSLYQ